MYIRMLPARRQCPQVGPLLLIDDTTIYACIEWASISVVVTPRQRDPHDARVGPERDLKFSLPSTHE